MLNPIDSPEKFDYVNHMVKTFLSGVETALAALIILCFVALVIANAF